MDAGVRGWCFKKAKVETTNLIEQGLKCFCDRKSLTITRPNITNTQGTGLAAGWGAAVKHRKQFHPGDAS